MVMGFKIQGVIFLFISISVTNWSAFAQYFLEQPTHVYIVEGDRTEVPGSGEDLQAGPKLGHHLMSRKGISEENEEEAEDESVEEDDDEYVRRRHPVVQEIMRRRMQKLRSGAPVVKDEAKRDWRIFPLSIEFSKGASASPGWGHKEPVHHHGGGQGGGGHGGWGWDSYVEQEKHKLKYEILKLKAKKKIAILQNKVELKKLLSVLLQKKIQALEWWR